MKPRVSVAERTPPLPSFSQFGAPPADSPALRRLISLGLGALVVWVFLGGLLHAWPRLWSTHPLQAQTLVPDVPDVPPAPTHVERALPVTRRALPVLGATYPATLPDGQVVSTTWKGSVARFSDLPNNPALGDEFGVKEGQGQSWIWAIPYGWNHAAWIDP